jgi:hypothetical protein
VTLLTPQSTPPNRVLPHLGSEVSRLTHRRLYRVLTLILLAGIGLVSVVAFLNHGTNQDVPEEAQAQYERELQRWDRQFADIQQGWEQCLTEVPEGESSVNYCGPEPDFERDKPRLEWFYDDPRYRAADNLPAVVLSVTMAAAMLAFILGASSGGAEWSSRSMTLQLLWEPRRLRLLSLKWTALALVTAATTVVALALGVALGAVTASLRGTWEGVDAGLSMDGGEVLGDFWPQLLLTAGRGTLLVVLAASFAYAIAMLVRSTGAALGTAFVYFAVVENAVRLALSRFGSEPWMLSTNALAFVIPGGLEVPGRELSPGEVDESADYIGAVVVELTNGRAFLTLLAYLALLAVPAVLSFTRRDVG